MSYYYSKTIKNIAFDQALEKVTDALSGQGFGVLTQIDIKETLKKKLNTDFRPYKILGACNPPFAFKALKAEGKIGTMLPCNVVVQQLEDDSIEVSAVDPVASMRAVENEELGSIAQEIQGRLKTVIENL